MKNLILKAYLSLYVFFLCLSGSASFSCSLFQFCVLFSNIIECYSVKVFETFPQNFTAGLWFRGLSTLDLRAEHPLGEILTRSKPEVRISLS